ncbi:16S rRNA (uracil(1498)-N(3))-methyltransferase [Mycoplasma flocculare]|uniref:Ribosomal RNA small subunit methyltransferase E n=2 Tax=Mesomycoplasma flocculare TaxID=2128 RepID=A0A0A8E7L5_MESFC|nr:16S rRNA (uracil(1498)-N(3))-methyltransferase [Mesomycoplasma flocculare]MXR39474.1 16S rRNA (uracil(1498)-N(3))-methyltransferase [Mycoplasma sp. MF12]AJC50003.1 16S ribosomal RNA methyltransferase RsmE [Mesomycoplasma flocculare ATCC 27399]ENX50972.1 26.3 kDa protein in cilium adhesin operon [Mesomycoplasma flocculare ATCC 27716]MXR05883.1 16S rRNA (uracil(1498)-N(3))-methyltransferase [Mesomycoplasma flocculare]MXR12295.1 16S rRNA (uracil(1498)-N(3))-methyltransferase [Mesomycoplasma fl
MFRFFVNEKYENFFILNDFILKHIKTVRIKHENFICVYNGHFYLTKLVKNSNKAEIITKININNEPKNEVVLALAVLKTKSFEFAIQKAVEIGVHEIWPFYSKNVNQKLNGDLSKKLKRWEQICLHSAQQSFRNLVPKINLPMNYNEILKKSEHFWVKLIAFEKEKSNVNFPEANKKTILMIGPEGGFSDEEVILAKKFGFQSISLGKRILRSETAAIFLLAKCIKD